MNWYRRWKSRREESRIGRLNPRPFLFPAAALMGIPIGLVLVGLGWVAVNCYTYTIDHPTKVAYKDHYVTPTSHCHIRDDDGDCTYRHTHYDDHWVLGMEDGYRKEVWFGEWTSVQVGQNYTYTTTHLACR